MAKDTAQASEDWLLSLTQLPGDDPAIRMRLLRTLDGLGAAVIRDGAYLLPDTAANRQALEKLSEYIVRNAGIAHVIYARAGSPAQDHQFRKLFDRSARYEQLVKVIESLKVSYGISDPGAISRVLHKQRLEFDTISALDFFPSEPRERAQQALTTAQAEIRKLVFSNKSTAGLAPGEKMLGRTWATRRPLWADRLACAWLVRRFVDPEATLLWLDKTQPLPADAIGFAYDGAHFGNSETRVTFEDMLQRLDLAKNAALVKIGGIVHFLEVQGTPVPEAAGVETLLQGAQRRANSDNELLLESEKTFDLIYEAYFEPAKR
jgi:hypothetical protein